MKPSLKAGMPVYSAYSGQPKEYVRTTGAGRTCPANSWKPHRGPYIIPAGFMQLARTHTHAYVHAGVGLTQGGSAYAADDGTSRRCTVSCDGASHRVPHCSDVGLSIVERAQNEKRESTST